jgi:hypothetical protein
MSPKTAVVMAILSSGFLVFVVVVKSLKHNKTKSMGDF